jgi:hypothetical protein
MRTQQQISDEMDRVQAQFPELANLTSKSDTSVFGLMRNMWIALQMTLDHYIDGVRAELVATAAAVRVGSLVWYVEQVKAFQFGDPIAVVGGRVGYDVIDASKRIVAQAAANESDGRLTIKVAKINPSAPSFMALADDELASLKNYISAVKYAGVAVDVVSLPPDQFRVTAIVKVNRQVLNLSGGMLASPTRQAALEQITNYGASLPFDGTLTWTGLTQYVMAYEGITDFVIQSIETRPNGATDWTPFTREYVSRAGHMQFISASLTYV